MCHDRRDRGPADPRRPSPAPHQLDRVEPPARQAATAERVDRDLRGAEEALAGEAGLADAAGDGGEGVAVAEDARAQAKGQVALVGEGVAGGQADLAAVGVAAE